MQPWLATESHIDTHLRLHATKRQRVSWPKKLKRRWTHAESTRPQNPHRPPVTCAAPCPRSLVTRNSDHIVDRTLPVVDPPCCLAGDPFFLLLHPSTFFCFPHAPSSPSWPYSRQPHPLRILNPPPFYFLKQGPSLRSRRLEPLASKLSLTTRTHFSIFIFHSGIKHSRNNKQHHTQPQDSHCLSRPCIQQ
ncbi:hypothetical protein J3E68DRAFT_120552 [Trichoderma sp. SZMC 28012]